MPSFGKRSLDNLATAHPELQRLFGEVIKVTDCTVICGHRGEDDQNRAVAEGKSKVRYPTSKHNAMPSLAVDVVPYPVDWDDTDRFFFLAGVVMGTAASLGIGIRWGGDWNGDGKYTERFRDLPHFELKG